MRTMQIFEPAMCCPTGLCGVGVDAELLRVSTVLSTLKNAGVEVQRFNLTNNPAAFVENQAVREYLQRFGAEKLPVTVVDGLIVIAGRYPGNAEFTEWLELDGAVLGAESSGCCSTAEAADEGCCGEDSSCCCEPADEDCCGPDSSCCAPEPEAPKDNGGCCCSGGSCC